MIPLRDKRPEKIEDWLAITNWLGIATRDICPEAQARIAQEIEAHFDEAVAARIAEGDTAADARNLALAELGDPDLAAKILSRKHLTTRENNSLVDLINRSSSIKALAWPDVLLVFVLCLLYPRHRYFLETGLIPGLVILSALSFLVAKRIVGRLRIASLLLLNEVRGAVFLICLYTLLGDDSLTWMRPALVVLSIALALKSFRTWNKLGRLKNPVAQTPTAV